MIAYQSAQMQNQQLRPVIISGLAHHISFFSTSAAELINCIESHMRYQWPRQNPENYHLPAPKPSSAIIID
jgi:hypothetical protein